MSPPLIVMNLNLSKVCENPKSRPVGFEEILKFLRSVSSK